MAGSCVQVGKLTTETGGQAGVQSWRREIKARGLAIHGHSPKAQFAVVHGVNGVDGDRQRMSAGFQGLSQGVRVSLRVSPRVSIHSRDARV
ncbi:uncharacterized protein VDAG_10286 [Verticillium dahliae VdLs.17]|uniref:Uncharacterized protein n=1 Tax=Verticillium dahliae (strain VdLs.17 / ATCC MYA-4575 / FGSC 10137) TaxID=498257 RepID=G2XJM3_VERDV|nr:uncharacterized protein VDAG_10286 [Verticillium dahliae VdLs.17]EGY20726.1 hypothetical protein VDAG_10286 [Verticillium dahliae VdLs.17]KAH6708101.1 hypothetical protein EV126DRAFT_104629 [Verticillium dahliae]